MAGDDDDRLRASDAERQRVIAALQRHAADGRLSMDEFGGRVDEVLAATTRGDLPHALRDLPTLPPEAPDDAADRRSRAAAVLAAVPLRTVAIVVLAVTVIAASGWQLWWLVFPLWGVLGGCGSRGACGRADADARDDDRELIRV